MERVKEKYHTWTPPMPIPYLIREFLIQFIIPMLLFSGLQGHIIGQVYAHRISAELPI